MAYHAYPIQFKQIRLDKVKLEQKPSDRTCTQKHLDRELSDRTSNHERYFRVPAGVSEQFMLYSRGCPYWVQSL